MPVNKLKSKISWTAIRAMVKAGIKPVDIERQFNGAISAQQIYRKRVKWNKQDYKTDPKYAKYRTPEYIAWRTACLKRDCYKCVVCGRGRPAPLQVDHIHSYSKYPEKRYDIENGQTLCIPCHKRTPNYGFKAAKYECSYEKNKEWIKAEKERIKLEKIKKKLKRLG